jgi:hypothetical protein
MMQQFRIAAVPVLLLLQHCSAFVLQPAFRAARFHVQQQQRSCVQPLLGAPLELWLNELSTKNEADFRRGLQSSYDASLLDFKRGTDHALLLDSVAEGQQLEPAQLQRAMFCFRDQLSTFSSPNAPIGAVFAIDSPESQAQAMSMIGSVVSCCALVPSLYIALHSLHCSALSADSKTPYCAIPATCHASRHSLQHQS